MSTTADTRMVDGVQWKDIEDYELGTYALFWVVNETGEYAVFGVIENRGFNGHDDEPRIWDDNDFGYSPASEVTHYADCAPPKPKHH